MPVLIMESGPQNGSQIMTRHHSDWNWKGTLGLRGQLCGVEQAKVRAFLCICSFLFAHFLLIRKGWLIHLCDLSGRMY